MTQIAVPPPQPTRNRWLPLAVAGAVVAVGGVITAVVLLTTGDSALAEAHTRCEVGTLDDEDQTLVVDMMGEEYTSGTATIDDVGCVLAALNAPTSVTARMDSTRALDGMQTATWDGYSVSWTYHPDDGLDLIITESD